MKRGVIDFCVLVGVAVVVCLYVSHRSGLNPEGPLAPDTPGESAKVAETNIESASEACFSEEQGIRREARSRNHFRDDATAQTLLALSSTEAAKQVIECALFTSGDDAMDCAYATLAAAPGSKSAEIRKLILHALATHLSPNLADAKIMQLLGLEDPGVTDYEAVWVAAYAGRLLADHVDNVMGKGGDARTASAKELQDRLWEAQSSCQILAASVKNFGLLTFFDEVAK